MADDVVYYVKAADRNEELRFSLRSLRNLEHGQVWLGGHCPPWVHNVRHVPTRQTKSKYGSARANLEAVLAEPELSTTFSLFNDDFYVMQRFERLPVLHRGTVRALLERYTKRGLKSQYVEGMRHTLELLEGEGIPDPLSYELHIPMTIERDALRAIFARWPAPANLQYRTLYGNLYRIGGELHRDVKVPGESLSWDKAWPFFSSSEYSFRGPRRRLDAHFRRPGPYERPDRSRQLLASHQILEPKYESS
jgi:hypothetical protein